MRLAASATLAAFTAALTMCACERSDGGPTDPGPVSLVTLNIASGAADRFRTNENRSRMGSFLARTGAEVIGFQEVDVGADRSGNVDTAASVAFALSPGFGACTFAVSDAPHFSADGTRIARCDAGTIVFGIGFRADDPFNAGPNGTPSGLIDADPSIDPTGVDRGADAWFGNALLVRAPWEVEDAYDVALPIDATGSAPPESLLAQLGRDARDADALAALAAHNLATRTRRAIEPRAALVVRVRKPGSTSRSVITTHLESAGTAALRLAQLDTLVAVARAERGDAGRPVVVMGDFNMSPRDSQPPLTAAGFVRAAAPPDGSVEVDQIWVDSVLATDAAVRVPTNGVSDHAYAATATVH